MIDTIALSLKLNEFEITNHDAFNPSSRPLLIPPYYPVRRGGMMCKNNPTKKLIQWYGYMPRLTLSKRPAEHGFTILLRVEASLPKLLYGNNLDEISNDDFDELCSKLSKQMLHMGVKVSADRLRQANVSAIHYSKNLPLTDYTSANMVIKEVAKGVVSRQLTGSKTDYDNDGTAFKLHANSYEIIVYDKLKDYQRSKTSPKRSKDVVYDNEQLLFSFSRDNYHKSFEVVKLEIRLGNRKKIKDVLSKIDADSELTFQELYDESLAKQVLKYYWNFLIPDLDLVVCSGFPSTELYDAIYHQSPDMKPSQILQMIGSLAIIQNDGMEGLRTRIERNASSHSWYSCKKKLKGLSITSHMRYNPIRIATQHLEAFTPLKSKNYQKE